MHKGKCSEISYKRSVTKKVTDKMEGITPGVDAAEILLEDVTLVMSSNCILKWFENCEDYYLQKTINGLYEKGGEPKYLQLEIVIPTEYQEKRLGKIIHSFDNAVQKRNIRICQCRVYADDISHPIINMTVIGITENKMSCKKIKPDMEVVMAGSIAIGGTAIISQIHRDRLSQKFSNHFVENCIKLKEYIDIKRYARIASDKGAAAMHSISDGGAFGAIWELASACGLGITVNIPKIPVWQETIEIAEMFDINPYLLDGTGALLIVSENGKSIVDKLSDEGIYANVIGTITDSKDRIAVNDDEVRYLEPPKGDELYKIL